jgi:nucleotide-binding universal stress UspA family protein
MTFQKILVALDLSFRSDFAFSRALQEANPSSSQLMLVHAQRLDPSGYGSSYSSARAGRNEAQDITAMLQRMQSSRMSQETHKAEEQIQAYCHQAIAQGIAAQVAIKPADPGVLICELAHRWGADLIVLARNEHGGIKSHAIGSVGSYVIHHAGCSVLIVQGVPMNPTPARAYKMPLAQSMGEKPVALKDDLANCMTTMRK